MPTAIQTLGIDKLPPDKQLALVRAIWDHIAASGPSPRLSDAQREELRCRVADDDARPDDVILWEQIRRHNGRDQ